MERIAEMEAIQEMITDQKENLLQMKFRLFHEKDNKKRNQLRDQIKRLKKALMEDMVKYSSTIKKWNKDDQKEEKGYEGDNEEGFGGGRKKRRKRTRRKKRTKRRRSSRHRRSKKRRTRRRRKTKRRRGGTLGTFAVPNQFSGGARSIYQTPTAIMKGGMNNVIVRPPTTTIMM